MRITITSVAGVSDGAGHHYRHKSTVDIDDVLARAWIAAGHACGSEAGTQVRTSKKGKRTADRPPAEDRSEVDGE